MKTSIAKEESQYADSNWKNGVGEGCWRPSCGKSPTLWGGNCGIRKYEKNSTISKHAFKFRTGLKVLSRNEGGGKGMLGGYNTRAK